jgi:hypothetical protein
MENLSDNIVIKSNQRYKGAPEVDYQVPASLDQNTKLLIETDRTILLSQSELFDSERQLSTTFRPTFKVDFLYKNNYTGTTSYNPFKNNLYIINGEKSLAERLAGVTETWYGLPQFSEFDLIRFDATNTHIDFKSESATTYNWDYYITYSHGSDTQYNMRWYQNSNGNLLANFLCSDGIPCTLSAVTINGANYFRFTCPVKHNLLPGEYVQFQSTTYNNNSYFEVDSIGDFYSGSDEYIFNISNLGYTGTTFQNGKTYIFKRVIDTTNTADTTSRYYIRTHKVLRTTTQLDLENAGFDNNPFYNPRQYEFSSITPNQVSRISKLTSSQSYTVTNKVDIDIVGLVDENQKPIQFLYLTFVNKGYAGWFYNQKSGLKRGWEFNINSPTISPWWDFNQPLSNETSVTKTYYSKFQNGAQYDFYYNQTLNTGDTIYGDWVEYNDYEQSGRTISPYTHKFVFNQKNFQIGNGNTNPQGYYYQVHNPIEIRAYSGYIEEGDPATLGGIPPYAYYSPNNKLLRWRDIYTYGYIDVDGNGVDYPFINETHYPYTNVTLRLIPEGALFGQPLSTFIPRPLIDECE